MTATERAKAHAKHGYYCTCGMVVYGNGAKYQHREKHRHRKDRHHYITAEAYRANFNADVRAQAEAEG